MSDFDVIIVGGGIGGASLGSEIAAKRRTLIIEAERHCGYHSTGRSAAFFLESYGGPEVAKLSTASRDFLLNPPANFSEHSFLRSRGDLHIMKGELPELPASIETRIVEREELERTIPGIKPEWHRALFEPGCADIDVAALHAAFLRAFRRAGGTIRTDSRLHSASRIGDEWHLELEDGSELTAGIIVNAAGAWCDTIAALAGVAPIGLVPKRRSIFTFSPPSDLDATHWPLFGSVDERWYVKPDAGLLLGSPANADPVPAQDVQPEDLDIAHAIDRIEAETTLAVQPRRRWAGLRSFVADGDLVGGFAPDAPGFFWVAAQGGYGIQTSAAMGEACAALARGLPLPARIAAFGLDAAALAPDRPSLTLRPASAC